MANIKENCSKRFALLLMLVILCSVASGWFLYDKYESYQANQAAIAADHLKAQQAFDLSQFSSCVSSLDTTSTVTTPRVDHGYFYAGYTMTTSDPTAGSVMSAAQKCFSKYSVSGNQWTRVFSGYVIMN